MGQLELGVERGAVFSEDRLYRYRLWRRWAPGRPVLFVMLNPSTADETKNDPTVERCERRARAWGGTGLEVVNIFAFRATDPESMKKQVDPVGPLNDEAIVAAAMGASWVVCAWGKHGAHKGRSAEVKSLLRSAGITPYALRVTGGEPHHPLYIPYSCGPVHWDYK